MKTAIYKLQSFYFNTLLNIKNKGIRRQKSLLEQRSQKRRSLLFFTGYLFCLPLAAHADVVGSLTNFLGLMTGGWGKAIATIAIVGLGYGCFAMGKVPKMALISVVVGIGLVFGGSEILQHIQGN
jgi:type IV secretory pathway VirB2 component (pilin)